VNREALNGPRVLVVDDEPQILRALQLKLSGEGYEVETAAPAADALAVVAAHPPEAVILDLLLPDGRGTEVCRKLRERSTAPVLMMSAVEDEAEKTAALDAGADDYLTKPFSVDELLARLRAALRTTPATDPILQIGDLRIDLANRLVTMAGRPVSLTPTEYDLLSVLAQNEGKLFTQRAIVREVWGATHHEQANHLHVHVSQLRRKLEPDPARPRYLLTQPGLGYRLVDPNTRD
jgi:two-component system, OmpR family, KDP operon response regulator KdpE